MIKNKTWKLIYLYQNWQVIIGKWYFKLQKDCNSQILKYNAKRVAHKFKCKKSINFVETFAIIIKLIFYKYLFEISIKYGYKIWQINVVIVFLHKVIKKIIYIEQPYLFKLNHNLVCYLRKALYRLKQTLQI